MKRAPLVTLALACATLLLPCTLRAQPALQTGTLPRGGSYFLVSDPGSPATAIDLWFRAPDDGYGANVDGLAQVAATAAAASRLESGRTLAQAVQQIGGEITISVFHDIIGIGVVVPAADARTMLASLTAAYFAPSIDESALHAAQTDAAVLAVQQQYDTQQILNDELFGHLFESGPEHAPPLPLAVSGLSQITLDEVNAFAQRAFRSSNAFLTLAGPVDASILDAVTAGSGAGGPEAPVHASPGRAVSEPVSREGAEAGMGIAWVGPPIADERAATALDFVGDYLFRPNTGTFVRDLGRSGDDVSLRGDFVTLHDPGIMMVTVDGSSDEHLEERIIEAVNALAQPLPAAQFAAAREAFLYHVGEDTQTAAHVAENLGWYAAEGAPAYAPGGDEYERLARSLDPDFVAATVRRYLRQPTVVRIVQPVAPKGASS